jgi:hypothetical protein
MIVCTHTDDVKMIVCACVWALSLSLYRVPKFQHLQLTIFFFLKFRAVCTEVWKEGGAAEMKEMYNIASALKAKTNAR